MADTMSNLRDIHLQFIQTGNASDAIERYRHHIEDYRNAQELLEVLQSRITHLVGITALDNPEALLVLAKSIHGLMSSMYPALPSDIESISRALQEGSADTRKVDGLLILIVAAALTFRA